GEHLLALGEHLLGFRVDVRKDLNRDSSIADQWRYSLNDLPVLVFLLLWAQGVARCHSLPNLRIFRDQAWVRGLTINKPDQFLNSNCFFRGSTIDQYFGFRLVFLPI